MSGKAHFFVAVVTLASLFFILRLVRTRRLRAKYSMLWISIGLALAVLAAFPRVLDRFSSWIGVAYPPTALFIVALALLLLVSVHFSWELSRLEERTRILAEEIAIIHAQETREILLTRTDDAEEGHPSSALDGGNS
jgi:hypothetical protein